MWGEGDAWAMAFVGCQNQEEEKKQLEKKIDESTDTR
jgi:hypothetical protein